MSQYSTETPLTDNVMQEFARLSRKRDVSLHPSSRHSAQYSQQQPVHVTPHLTTTSTSGSQYQHERTLEIGRTSRSVSAEGLSPPYEVAAEEEPDSFDRNRVNMNRNQINIATKDSIRRSLSRPMVNETVFSPVKFVSQRSPSPQPNLRSDVTSRDLPTVNPLSNQFLLTPEPASLLGPAPQLDVFAPVAFIRRSTSGSSKDRNMQVIQSLEGQLDQYRSASKNIRSPSGPRGGTIPVPDMERMNELAREASQVRQRSNSHMMNYGPGGFARTTNISNFRPDPKNLLIEALNWIAASKQVQPPEIPGHVLSAFERYVAKGQYFVKYPGKGSCHERYFHFNMIASDYFARQPYLEWATHDRAVSTKGRLHLSFLTGVEPGLGNPAFHRFLLDGGRTLRGPIIVDAERCVLPADYAFTLHFHEPAHETVNLLALDPDVYQAWLIVCSFVANCNSAQIIVEDTQRPSGSATT